MHIRCIIFYAYPALVGGQYVRYSIRYKVLKKMSKKVGSNTKGYLGMVSRHVLRSPRRAARYTRVALGIGGVTAALLQLDPGLRK